MVAAVAVIVSALGDSLKSSGVLRYLCALVTLCLLLSPLFSVVQTDLGSLLSSLAETTGTDGSGDLSAAAQSLARYCEESLTDSLTETICLERNLTEKDVSIAVAVSTVEHGSEEGSDGEGSSGMELAVASVTVRLHTVKAIAQREPIRASLSSLGCPLYFEEVLQ